MTVQPPPGTLYAFGPFRLEPDERRLTRDGAPVEVPPKALDLLVVLVERAGHLVPKDELLDALWPDVVVEENALSVQVSKLRAALGETAREWHYIETVPRGGYRFAPEVVFEPGAPEANGSPAEPPGRPPGSPLARPQALGAPPRRAAGRPARWWASGLAVLLVALVLAWAWGNAAAPPPPVRTIAVLPLRPLDLAAGDDLDALGLGLADALITQLGGDTPLSVRPTSAVVPFAAETDPYAAARALQVDAVLDGRIQQEGGRLRVTVQLLPTQGRAPLWSGAFTAEGGDLLAVQDAIARQVVAALALELNPAQQTRFGRRATESPAAHRAYLVGRYHWSKRTDTGIAQAITAYRDALDADPVFALAWAALGEAYAFQPWYAAERPRAAFPRAAAAARRALEIDPGLAEAHAVLAQVAWQYEGDTAAAERHFQRALALGPEVAAVRQWHGEFLAYTGRTAEGVAELRSALALDPLSLVIATDIGTAHFFARRFDRAEAAYREVLDMEPSFGLAWVFLAMVHEQQGRPDAAVAALRRVATVEEGPLLWRCQLGRAYAVAGRRSEAEALLARLEGESADRFVSPYGRALIREALGDAAGALALLDAAVEARDPYLVYLAQDPQLDGLRGDARAAPRLVARGL